MDDIDINTMIRMYRYAKKKENDEDIPFLKICCYECPDDKKFTKKWLEYLNPDEFKNKKEDVIHNKNIEEKKKEEEKEKEEDDDNVYLSLNDLIKSEK